MGDQGTSYALQEPGKPPPPPPPPASSAARAGPADGVSRRRLGIVVFLAFLGISNNLRHLLVMRPRVFLHFDTTRLPVPSAARAPGCTETPKLLLQLSRWFGFEGLRAGRGEVN